MQHMHNATRAYQASSGTRNFRLQEAEVFQRATGALRAGQAGGILPQVRALADNRQLWLTVIGLVQDPANALPESLRASLVSVGMSVQREMDQASPDFGFLIAVNENIAAGLVGTS